MSFFKPQNSISWLGSITDEIILFSLYKITKKHELLLSAKDSLKVKLNPNQMLCLGTHGEVMQLHSVKKHKNVIKERHHYRKGVQSFTMEFYQVSEKSYRQHRSQYDLIQLKNIFLWRKFINSEILTQSSVYSQLASYCQIKYLETSLICILDVVSLLVRMQHCIPYEIFQSTG